MNLVVPFTSLLWCRLQFHYNCKYIVLHCNIIILWCSCIRLQIIIYDTTQGVRIQKPWHQSDIISLSFLCVIYTWEYFVVNITTMGRLIYYDVKANLEEIYACVGLEFSRLYQYLTIHCVCYINESGCCTKICCQVGKECQTNNQSNEV